MKRRKGASKKRTLAGVLSIVAVIAIVLGCFGVGVSSMVNSWFEDMPDYESADAFNTSMPTYVYAADRETVLARFQLENREPVEMNQISPLLSEAVIAIEDARFYEHSGVDYYGVMRALVNNLTGGSLEGASTITQQFVRNTILADEMDDISVKRKVREAYIAMELEKRYNKDAILLMYL
ncbi:MAG: transglycosylase domain-containing protein, partial [Eggerthellaceae bacterium]|nr:transglycosylase domain-containing protein [Eggerthellaceae bacterium]